MPSPARMSTASPSSAPPPGTGRFAISPRSRRIVLIGFAAGLAIGLIGFLLLWLDQRNDSDFFRAAPTAPERPGQVFEPLPAPRPGADGRSVSGLSEAAEALARNPPPAAQAAPPVSSAVSPADGAAPAAARDSAPGGSITRPEPLERTPPEYPSAALRRGESGTVLVRAEVDASGRPTEVSVARSSRSRALDRAAVQAVRRWRFSPAQQDGRPVAGTIEVPIEFKTN